MAGKRNARKVNDEGKMESVPKNEDAEDVPESRQSKKRVRPARNTNSGSYTADEVTKKTRRGRSTKAERVDYSELDYDSESDESERKQPFAKMAHSDSDEPVVKKSVPKKRGKRAKKVAEEDNHSSSDNNEEENAIENDAISDEDEDEKPAKKRGRRAKSAASKPKQDDKLSSLTSEKKKLTEEIRAVENCKS